MLVPVGQAQVVPTGKIPLRVPWDKSYTHAGDLSLSRDKLFTHDGICPSSTCPTLSHKVGLQGCAKFPFIFCENTILQVIWPSPGTLFRFPPILNMFVRFFECTVMYQRKPCGPECTPRLKVHPFYYILSQVVPYYYTLFQVLPFYYILFQFLSFSSKFCRLHHKLHKEVQDKEACRLITHASGHYSARCPRTDPDFEKPPIGLLVISSVTPA